MIRQGLLPILAGRDEEALAELAEELTGEAPSARTVDTALVDASSSTDICELLTSSGDVLVSAIDGFAKEGTTALRAAIDAGCGYIDCAWEPQFLRKVFSGYAAAAAANGAVVLPSFGCYYVAGTLAATIAVRRTMTINRPPARVDIGYFSTGAGRGGAPGEALIDDSFRWAEGRIKTERPGSRIRSFDLGGGRHQEALSLGSTEHFTVPRLAKSIAEVNVYMGWFGRFTRAAAVAGAVAGSATKMPAIGGVWDSVFRGLAVNSTTGAPETASDGHARTVVIAETYDADGGFQQRVRVEGPGPRELTGSLLSWGAGMLVQGVAAGEGTLGPAEAFGTEALISGCMALGLAETRYGF